MKPSTIFIAMFAMIGMGAIGLLAIGIPLALQANRLDFLALYVVVAVFLVGLSVAVIADTIANRELCDKPVEIRSPF